MNYRAFDNHYDDIIDLPHHVSNKRAPMSLCARAAQFSPFSALTGYDKVVKETERLTREQIELDEKGIPIEDLMKSEYINDEL